MRALAALAAVYGRDAVIVQARRELDALRERMAAGETSSARSRRCRRRSRTVWRTARPPATRRVLNATGIFLHTNLGRAPLPRRRSPRRCPSCSRRRAISSSTSRPTAAAIVSPASAALLEALTGAEAAIAVNNNAAAMVLALATLAAGREVIVSRGELVEIGDSFRIPEILAAAGARLVEVGTTNRTHLADYERALGPQSAALLKVHTSNYRVRGFVAAVEVAALAALGARAAAAGGRRRRGPAAPHPAPSSPITRASARADRCRRRPRLRQRRQAVGRSAGRPPRRPARARRALPAPPALSRAAAGTRRRDCRSRRCSAGISPASRCRSIGYGSRRKHTRPRSARVAAALGAEVVPARRTSAVARRPTRGSSGEALALPGDEPFARAPARGDRRWSVTCATAA
jgi:hypothetical protein